MKLFFTFLILLLVLWKSTISPEVFLGRWPSSLSESPFTFGFEVEFRGEKASKVLGPSLVRVDRDSFPYLSADIGKEVTGNLEVRSTGGEKTLNEVLAQMREMKNVLGSDAKSFHLHMRFPVAMLSENDEHEVKAFFSRLSDYVYAWRVQYKHPGYSLRSYTLSRQNPDEIDDKGTIRLQEFGQLYDLEIRGFMSDIDQIEEMANLVTHWLLQGGRIAGVSLNQWMLASISQSLEEKMRLTFGDTFTAGQAEKLRELQAVATVNGDLPLYSWKELSFVTKEEKIIFTMAEKKFLTGVHSLLLQKNLQQETEDGYRELIKAWANDVDLFPFLKRHLFSSQHPMLLSEGAKSHLEKVLSSLKGDKRLLALMALKNAQGPLVLPLLVTASSDKHETIRDMAKEFIGNKKAEVNSGLSCENLLLNFNTD